MISDPVQRVREAYDFFDERRARDQPFDEGDMQNIHSWMREVTYALEEMAEEVAQANRRSRRVAYESDPLNRIG